MSDVTSLRKKRPPKLKLSTEDELPPPNPEPQATISDHSATSYTDDRNLDSSTVIQLEDRDNILINPQNLNVLEQLGRGQYGIVEKVRHNSSGHEFAVKRVALPAGNDNEKGRLLMDVDILVKGTECKNIIKFYGALIWEGDLWIIMELMDCPLDKFYKLAHREATTPSSGGSLDSRRSFKLGPCNHSEYHLGNCDFCNPIPEKVLGRMASDIVNALSYLYSIKVIHRDIKPSNMLINKEGLIKLCDFGISGYLVNSVARTYEAGCRPYMAPERIDPPKDRTGYDIKSDVWSFGITMVEIATGRYPYHYARDFFEQLKRICAEEPPKLPEGTFSPAFRDFIDQCLKKDYQERPKYSTLSIHPFICSNKDTDICNFSQKVLSYRNSRSLNSHAKKLTTQ